jgi:hypothetical protein
MPLPRLLQKLTDRYSADALRGAIIFVRLDRPVDDLISESLALGPYHRGKPSPWSHCFLLAEPYRGPETAILDCAVRDGKGRLIWNWSLQDTLTAIYNSSAGQAGAGGIYAGTVEDYASPGVTACGARWIPGLSTDERSAVVAAARKLKEEGYRYDVPGLGRELARLIFGLSVSPEAKHTFCSSFVQMAYRGALKQAGDFALDVRDADTTPDDLWYSQRGFAVADETAVGPAIPANAVLMGAGGAAPDSTLAATDDTALKREVERLLGLVKGSPDLPEQERIESILQRALAQLKTFQEDPTANASSSEADDEYELSLVRSAIETPNEPTTMSRLLGREVPGLREYEMLDPRWIKTLFVRATHQPVSFPPLPPRAADLVYSMPEATTIAIAGDWGTGNASSVKIATKMKDLKPDYTIHLGDVYYSGSESEEHDKFVSLWPAGTRGSFTLNSNHEMYSGGRGYFGVALADSKFRMQQGRSHFALTNSGWLLIGLDSAYAASNFYMNGALNDAQLTWLRALLASDIARSGGSPKNIIVMTHHHGLEYDGKRVQPLWSQVTNTLVHGPHRWYWGHVHGAAAFKPVTCGGVNMKARLVGHGGVPYAPDKSTNSLEWIESELAGDPKISKRALNGFAFLTFTNDLELEERFFDENGRERWKSQ